MTLNDLLRSQSIDPAGVFVFRHCPSEPELRKVLPWLAAASIEPSLCGGRRSSRKEWARPCGRRKETSSICLAAVGISDIVRLVAIDIAVSPATLPVP